MNFTAFDLETTGLSPESSEVVEFAAVRVRGGELDLNLASLCRPLHGISYGAMRVNGITYDMVADKPTFAELLPSLLSFFGDDTIVCHNAPFDMSFLMSYCRKAGVSYSPKIQDTLQMARRLLPGLPSRSLEPLAAHLNVRSDGYHRALADATVTAKVYLKLMELDIAADRTDIQ